MTMQGVCLSQHHCSKQNGVPDGKCAEGFGVCCMFTTSMCGATVDKNCTYIQNPGYPSPYQTSSVCSYQLKSSNSEKPVCQLRLDFTVTQLETAPNGDCIFDQLIITGPTGTALPTFCGTLTGSHVYVETARSSTPVILSITIGPVAAFQNPRMWKIKVYQIECMSVSRAPTDCLQYYTGVGNHFTSFNYEGGVMIRRQRYNICIRQEKGFCSIAYSTYPKEGKNPFQIGTPMKESVRNRDVCKAGLTILSSGFNLFKNAHSDIYCGGHFNSVELSLVNGAVFTDMKPYVVGVSIGMIGSPIENNVGFSLKYTQLPC